MRTSGTFLDVYRAAASDSDSDLPINPVIRREGDTWMLESALNPTDGDIEVTLEEFCSYWYEGMMDSYYLPSDQDVAEWVSLIQQAHAESARESI